MQADWAVIRRGSNRLSVFVATLGWSRAAYVEFVSDERVETLIDAHENAFLLIIDEIGYLPLAREQANSSRSSPSATRRVR